MKCPRCGEWIPPLSKEEWKYVKLGNNNNEEKREDCTFEIVKQQLEDVLSVLAGLEKTHDIIPKRGELEESVGEAFQKFHDEMNRRLKFHGIFETDNVIMIDKKQGKFVILKKKTLRELFETRPIWEIIKHLPASELNKLYRKRAEEWFMKAEEKVLGETKRELKR